jgi:hypothetical protein
LVKELPPIVSTSDEVILEEITSGGEGVGLEAERQGTEGAILYPFAPEDIDVITQSRTIDLLLTRLREGELDLSPDFQRRGNLWTVPRKSGLIESVLLRIPIPSLYISEDKNGDYTVVDGLQRLCAIAHFVDHAALNTAVNAKLDPMRLEKLESLTEYNNSSYAELPRKLQRRILETELTLHVIRPGTPPKVRFNIFSRINRGGLPLTAQEIRNAIYPGKWRDTVKKMSKSSEFLAATNNKIKGERMEDLELILRFAAHLRLAEKNESRPSDDNLDDFLNEYVEKHTAGWDDKQWANVESAFSRAMLAAPKVFGYMAFRKYSGPTEPRKPINRGLFETESVALACRSEAELTELAKGSATVRQLFKKYFDGDLSFSNSLLYATGRGSAANTRLRTINSIFDEVLGA